MGEVERGSLGDGVLTHRPTGATVSRHHHDLHVPLPADEVFELVTDPAVLCTWQPTIAGITRIDAPRARGDREGTGGLELGTRVREERRFLGHAAAVTWTVVEHAPPRRAAIAVTEGPVRGGAAYTLTPTPEGTHLAIDLEVEPRGVARLLAPGLAAAAAAELARSVARLERLLCDRRPVVAA